MTLNTRPRLRAFEYGYTVDVPHLLFARGQEAFLVKRDGSKVKPADLEGKTIVLIIFNYLLDWDDDDRNRWSWFMLDMVDAYAQLVHLGVQFVFVPVGRTTTIKYNTYKYLLSTMPWPALPFDDINVCGRRVTETFSMDASFPTPFWVIIDPSSRVVATKSMYPHLFKLFGGAELYPLRRPKIRSLWLALDPWSDCNRHGHHYRCESRKQIITKWDEQLASPPRDFLLSSNGDEVPISSLHDKVIGLYFCENIPDPPNMELIKKVYNKAKKHGCAFEIVQINFHYHFFNAIYSESADLDKEVAYEDIKWLRLPFKDPSCRKLQRMFQCRFDDENNNWCGDCLVIIDPRKVDSTQVLFEFSGAEIMEEYGIQGYPFTRPSLFETERKRQREELTLKSVFAQGGDWGNLSQLIGKKRVIVLLGGCGRNRNAFLDGSGTECKTVRGEAECKSRRFVSMLKSKYLEQKLNEAPENWFEVVFVSMDSNESSFFECTAGMPWVVHPFRREFSLGCARKIFRNGDIAIGAAAFDIDGRLIAKERNFCRGWEENDEFPFVSQDWDWWIKYEVEYLCQFYKYNYHIDCQKMKD